MEKQQTFTFEDALIAKEGVAILAGAGLFSASSTDNQQILIHAKGYGTANTASSNSVIDVSGILNEYLGTDTTGAISTNYKAFGMLYENDTLGKAIEASGVDATNKTIYFTGTTEDPFEDNASVFVDFYIAANSGVTEISIEPDTFGGYFYVEGDTVWRSDNGDDYPAQLTIPKLKVQTAMNITMAGSGDPSTFTFTGDAFPEVINGGRTGKKVLSTINILDQTKASATIDSNRSNQGVSVKTTA